MLSSAVDHWLATFAFRTRARQRVADTARIASLMVNTPAGRIRCTDSGGEGPVIVMTPDGPNVIEHYKALIERLSPSARVICFDMPGFGFSVPAPTYSHSLNEGAQTVLAILDHFKVARAVLAFSCANGFYALRAAGLAPQRIGGLVLSQTPSLPAMHAWTARIVPKVLRIPVLGQVLGWLFREKAATGWYRAALPRGADVSPFQRAARNALHCGACFSLSGVVQGLLKEQARRWREKTFPAPWFGAISTARMGALIRVHCCRRCRMQSWSRWLIAGTFPTSKAGIILRTC